MRKGLILVAVASVLVAAVWLDLMDRSAEPAVPNARPAADKPLRSGRAGETRVVSREERQAAIARAQIWREPAPRAGLSQLPFLIFKKEICHYRLLRNHDFSVLVVLGVLVRGERPNVNASRPGAQATTHAANCRR